MSDKYIEIVLGGIKIKFLSIEFQDSFVDSAAAALASTQIQTPQEVFAELETIIPLVLPL